MQLKLKLPPTDNEWKRSKHGCTRNPKAGPGSCWFWWEMCPDKVANCYLRWLRNKENKHGGKETGA